MKFMVCTGMCVAVQYKEDNNIMKYGTRQIETGLQTVWNYAACY